MCCHNFLCSHKFHKIANYFSFEVVKKKIWANFQIIIELFTQKIVTKLSKIWIWDLGSGIRDPGSGKNLFRIPDPGVKKAPDPGSATLLRRYILCIHSAVGAKRYILHIYTACGARRYILHVPTTCDAKRYTQQSACPCTADRGATVNLLHDIEKPEVNTGRPLLVQNLLLILINLE
jgi:hypothetical protein